jgi:hypothetical protein
LSAPAQARQTGPAGEFRAPLVHRRSDAQRVAGAGALCQHVGHTARANRQNLDDRRGLAGQIPNHGSNPRVNRAHLPR